MSNSITELDKKEVKMVKKYARKYKMSKGKPKSDTYFYPEEIDKLLSIIDNLEDKTLFIFGLNVGLRVSELVNIKTKDLDLDRGVCKIFDFKKDEERIITFPLSVSNQLRIYLSNRKRESKFLFPFSERTVNRKIQRWCKKAGVRKGTSHWFRHTFIRLSQRVGRNLKIVQQNTGDTVETILKWYSSLSDKDRVNEMNKKPIMKEVV